MCSFPGAAPRDVRSCASAGSQYVLTRSMPSCPSSSELTRMTASARRSTTSLCKLSAFGSPSDEAGRSADEREGYQQHASCAVRSGAHAHGVSTMYSVPPYRLGTLTTGRSVEVELELAEVDAASDAFDIRASFRNALIRLVFPARASPRTRMRKSSCIIGRR